MRFLFIYHGGRVPADETRQNIARLWEWLGNLKQVTNFVANGGNSVNRDSVKAYQGKVFGISIIEAETMQAAVEHTRDWPELQYGGHVEILQEL